MLTVLPHLQVRRSPPTGGGGSGCCESGPTDGVGWESERLNLNEEGIPGLAIFTQFSYLSKLVGAIHCLPIIIWSPAVEKYPEGRARAPLWWPTQASQSQVAMPCLGSSCPPKGSSPGPPRLKDTGFKDPAFTPKWKMEVRDKALFFPLETFPL